MTQHARWYDLRYGALLELAARDRRGGRVYALLASVMELALHPDRRPIAVRRIERWLGLSRRAARRTFFRSLVSEAREEADSVYLARDDDRLASYLASADCVPPPAGATIYATLHFGSPLLGYLWLRRRAALDVTVVARPLDASNPMPEAKRTYARGKIAWIERTADRAFLATDAVSITRARELLLGGGALWTPIDVPAAVAARAATVPLFGDRVRLASGIETLARLTSAAVQPIVAVAGRRRLEVRIGPRLSTDGAPSVLAAAIAELSRFVRQWPGEWWMWPHLETLEPTTQAAHGSSAA